MKQIAIIPFLCLSGFSAVAQSNEFDSERTKWIDNVLRSMETIQVGMTRSELLKVFTTEGGLSTTSKRTYVYRQCPYIKIVVKFDAASREEELSTDKVLQISRPYLDWSIVD
jgi:hypothetical protein